jgi:hypothetical protein
MRHAKNVILILSLLTTTLYIAPTIDAQTQYYLTVTTDPTDILTINPGAVTGEGWYTSGFVVVDAVQTVISSPFRYEFREWLSNDNEEYLEYDDENTLNGNQGAYFMDSDRTAVALYEQVNTLYYLTLLSNPDYLAIDDPSILQGEGWYSSGEVSFSAEPLVVDWDNLIRWEFDKWTTIYGEPTSLGNPATYFMDGDYTFIANYEVQSYYLDVTTDPTEILDLDPGAVWGADWYYSGTYGLVEAKTIVNSDGYRYELIGWIGNDGYYDDEWNEIPLPPYQAGHFMDSPFTMVAVYELVYDIEYEHIFTDHDSPVEIKISSDDQYFEISTPGKSYEPRQANRFIVRRNSVEILHNDSELSLVLYANSRIDFCLAYIKDKDSGESYIIRDKIGQE